VAVMMAKFLLTAICVASSKLHWESALNSPELLLLKILPLFYHHSHFWATTFDFTTFFILCFFALATPFFTIWLFCVDFTSFCNLA